jgi:hypothetical protein
MESIQSLYIVTSTCSRTSTAIRRFRVRIPGRFNIRTYWPNGKASDYEAFLPFSLPYRRRLEEMGGGLPVRLFSTSSKYTTDDSNLWVEKDYLEALLAVPFWRLLATQNLWT